MQVFEGKVSREGRLQLPKALRDLLEADEGTVLRIVVGPDGVQLINPARLLMQVWANNTGGDAHDSGVDVRAARDEDAQIAEADLAAEDDARSEAQITADLMSALGISA